MGVAVALTQVELSPEEKAVVQKIADKVVRWGITVPAIMFLEVHRPLAFVASQGLHMMSPFVSMFLDPKELDVLAKMLERRETIEEIIVAIEATDARVEDTRRAVDAQKKKKSSGGDQP